MLLQKSPHQPTPTFQTGGAPVQVKKDRENIIIESQRMRTTRSFFQTHEHHIADQGLRQRIHILRQYANVFSAMLGSTVDSKFGFSSRSHFSAMLGSPVDSKFASVRVRISGQYFVRQWIHGLRHFVHSSGPLVSGRHLFGIRVARGTGIWSFWEMTFFLRPLVSDSHLFGVRLWSTGL